MWQLLVGGVVGLVGAVSCVVTVLVYRSKVTTLQGALKCHQETMQLMDKQYKEMQDKYKGVMASLAQATLTHAVELQRRDIDKQILVQREEQLRELLHRSGDPSVVIERIGQLFVS